MKTNTVIPSNREVPSSRNGRYYTVCSPAPMRWCLPRILVAFAAAVCACPTTTQSQTVGPAWTTVDNIENPGAVAGGVAADGAGNLFVAGYIEDATGATRGLIQQSSDPGQTSPGQPSWSTPANTDIPGGKYERIIAKGGVTVAAASQGGACRVLGRSLESSGNWSDLMETPFRHENPNYTLETIWDVELDAKNNIYVAAQYQEKVVTSIDKRGTVRYSYLRRHVILKRVDGVWQTPLEPEFLVKKIVASGTDIYCSGDVWRVRKSSDGGVTWVILENFIDPQFDSWAATEIALDLNGALFVTGRVTRPEITIVRNKKVTTRYEYWMVRKGLIDNGIWTWVPTDYFRTGSSGAENVALAVTVDKLNNVFVTGRAGVDALTSKHAWLTRKYSPTDNQWITTDQFIGDGYDAQGNRIAADPVSGNVFATGGLTYGGLVYGGTNYPRWIVRRQLAPQP